MLIVRKEDCEIYAEWIQKIETRGMDVLCVEARLMEQAV